jgi:hypothetical protein
MCLPVFAPDLVTLHNRLNSLPPESRPSGWSIRPSVPDDLDGDGWDDPLNRYVATAT